MKHFLIIFLLLFTYLNASIINVPTDQPTIQSGIDVSANADTILVEPGTYVENINYNSKNIAIASLFLTTQDTSYISQTIIDGNENGSVVRMEGLSSEARLIGFTLTNGSGDDFVGIDTGGALYINNSDSVLEYLIIKDNYAEQAGAIACNQSEPVFNKVLIFNNNADISSIALGMLTTATFINCTIVDNTANDYCGGIVCSFGCEITLINSIMWGNQDFQIGFYDEFAPNEATISYSNIQGGEAGIETNNNGVVNWLEGNLEVNPEFIDPLIGNYHLSENSPCIDAGDPNSSLDPDGTIADMGAVYYYQLTGIENYEISKPKSSLANYPNPFNPETNIQFDIKQNDTGILTIYNIKGQIIESHQFGFGKHNYLWDASNQSSGIYLYKLQTKTITETKKMLLLK